MRLLLSYKFTLIYLALIPAVNLSFVYVPTVALPDGGQWAPMAIITGLILVFRDFAQREIGHYIFIPLLIGVALSYAMAGPQVALASGAAFLISELVDWAVYSVSKRPLSQRILISSAIAAPLDSSVFFLMADSIIPGLFTLGTVSTSIVSKLVGAFVVSRIVRRREQLSGQKPA